LLRELVALLPNCPIVGGSSHGEVSNELGYRVGSAVLVAFASDHIKMQAGVLRGLTFDDEATNHRTALTQWLPLPQTHAFANRAPALGLLFPDGIGLDGGAVLRLFAAQYPKTQFFGGAAAEDFHLQPTAQFFNTEVLHNAVPYLLFYGPVRYHWSVTEGLSSGWQAVGARLDAQCQGKFIRTINGHRATDQLAERYQLEGGLLSVVHPFVIYPDRNSDEHYLRDVVRYHAASGAVESMQSLPDACQIQLTQPNIEAILTASRQGMHRALALYPGNGAPAGVLCFSCASRALVLQQNPAAEFETATQGLQSRLPMAGFYAYGEIAPGISSGDATFHSASLVTLVLGKEPKPTAGIFSAQAAFTQANLERDKQMLSAELAEAQAALAAVRYELSQYQARERIAAHSKTEQHAVLKSLALRLVCEVLDTRLNDFKRLAIKGDPPRLNKTGLARMVNDLHYRHYGTDFPLTLNALAALLTENGDGKLLI